MRSLCLAERAALHGVVGAAMAALGGGNALDGLTGAVANQLAFNAIHDYLTETLELEKGSPAFNLLLQLGSAAVGAAVSGGTGAATALSATQNNWLKHWEFEALKEADSACGQGNQAACQRAEELRILDQTRDREYAAYATTILETLKAEGINPTEEEFSRRMDSYWSANGVNRRDVVYPEGGFIPTYPTRGQELYGFLGRLAENLPEWYPGKAPAEFGTTLMQGLLEQGGEAVAGWRDLFSPGQGLNWFTGDAVTGVDAWEAQMGSGMELVAGWLSGSNILQTGVRGARSVGDNIDAIEVESPLKPIPSNVKGPPKPPQAWQPPTNPPQLPPQVLPPGHTIRVMGPTENYPNGYWRQYDSKGNAVNPVTGKQPTGGRLTRAQFNSQTHVPLPPKG